MRGSRKVAIFVLLLLLCWPTAASAKPPSAKAGCTADVNFDNVVNLFDLVAVAQAYRPDAPVTGSPCDLNGDGYVNLLDLVLVAMDLGQCPGSECIQAEDAARYLGQNVCVDFQVVNTRRTTEQAFLNSHYPFEGHFYVYIHNDKWHCWPQLPDEFFAGKYVRVSGLIHWYAKYNAPEIVVQDCRDIVVI